MNGPPDPESHRQVGPTSGTTKTSQLQRSTPISGKRPEMGQEVVAHVYDVYASGSDSAVFHINRFFKDAVGLGGIFHTAIQVYGDDEWSFGYCERGSGVFSCPPCKNPMYTFRESIVLGKTTCSIFTVNQILRELSREWPGRSYEILSRNCNHFCNEFCSKLDVPKLPGWVNRFANAGDAALEVAETATAKMKQAKKGIMSACTAASTYLTGASSSTPTVVEDTGGSSNKYFFEGTWISSMIDISMKPSKGLLTGAPDDETSEVESESDQIEDQTDATQKEDTECNNEPHHHP